ncbi:hypothetical protein IM40_02715 [Candidatus Paracaedimonas acanthamoebae]|nr:hypothetical protein IM40_02715 [Candidatus Paracaedimonas acanthamoebae]
MQNEQLFDETLSQFSIRSVENSSQIKSEISEILLDFDSLPFHMAGPPRYTLLMVDPKRISSTTPNLEDWKKNGEDFAYIGPSFLKAGLITDGDINFDINVNNEKSRWIKIHKDQTKEQRNYYIVQLLKKEQRLRTLNFVESLISDIPQRTHDFTLQAGLIIFPYGDRAMVYGLHHWNILLNPAFTTQQWGLRILASNDVFNPRGIKSISATYYRTANPSSRYENKNKLVPIEDFMIEIGSESLESMRALPHNSYKTSGVFEGKDFLSFKIGPRNPRTGTVKETLESLERIANHFFKMSRSRDFQIHERMREFIDEEVRDLKVLEVLNAKLLKEIKSSDNKARVFIDDSLWREYKNHYISFGEQGNKSLFKIIEKKKFYIVKSNC